ncbi:hypothetical protein OTB20_42350, partial [Streptomyces sp. H27-H1]|uniref:hypothetical protein n=1 Tax=Streptomyces sp. H27-H1 TaxID=2996461 RepID=UPI00226FB3FD
MSEYVIRPVQGDEWAKVKELRIAALRDPAAAVAFLETLEQGESRTDEFWQDRAAGASAGRAVRQFVAEAPDGEWVGTVTVLVEEAGADDIFQGEIEQTQGHLVGVFVRPGQRAGLLQSLLVLDRCWSGEAEEFEGSSETVVGHLAEAGRDVRV